MEQTKTSLIEPNLGLIGGSNDPESTLLPSFWP
jgi:hypothetical protein